MLTFYMILLTSGSQNAFHLSKRIQEEIKYIKLIVNSMIL